MARSLWVVLALLSLAMVGCAPLSSLRQRATFDLNCPEDALELTELAGGGSYGYGSTYGVAGCGRRATYIYNGGAWVANLASVETTPGGTANPAVAPAAAPAEVRPAYSLPPAGTPIARVFAAAAEAERSGRLDEAAAYYDWIARADVTNAESLARLGAVQLRLGHTEAAVTATQASLNRLPPNAPTTLVASLLVQLGTAQETAGWVETARTTYERAASLDPQNAAATAGVARNTPAPPPPPVVPTADPTVP